MLQGIYSKFEIIHDIIIITTKNLQHHENEWDKVFNKLDQKQQAINVQKYEISKST